MRVLIVDDEYVQRELVGDILRDVDTSAEVFLAHGGETGYQIASEKQPFLVMTDIMMPDLDGIGLIRKIRAIPPPFRQPFIVVLTGFANLETAKAAFKFGVNAYIEKPYRISDLKDCYFFARSLFENENMDLTRWVRGGEFVQQILDSGEFLKDNLNIQTESSTFGSVIAEVAGSFCHDLRNDLLAIAGLHELKRTHRLTERIAGAQQTLSDFHKFAQQFYSIEPSHIQPVDKSEIKPIVEQLASNLYDECDISVQVNVVDFRDAPEIPRVILTHLVSSLVQNSIDALREYCDSGTGKVEINIGPVPNQRLMEIAVSDNGPGWLPSLDDVRQAVSDDKRLTTKDDDRGYGLRNVQRIVRKLKGDMFLDNVSPHGAKVRLVLPRRK